MAPIQIHSGRAGGIIDHALGLLMALPSMHASPPTLNTDDAREAESVEKFLAAVFEAQLLANDFWPSVGREVLIYGRGFIKAMPMPTVWTIQEGYPVRDPDESPKEYLERIKEWKETEAKFPFVIRHVPTLDILPMLDANDNVLATIEEKWVIAKILSEEMKSGKVKELLDRGSIKWYDELPVVEYIDSEHVAYFLAGTQPREKMNREETIFEHVAEYERLRTWEHGLGKCPVVMITGVKTEIPEYELRYKGFLHDAKDALETYDFLLSRLATMVYAYYLPSYTWKIAATSAHFQGRERPEMKVELGGVTVTYADEQLDVLPFPQNLPDASDLLSQVDDVIQRHTLEDVLFGRVAGTAPAFQVQLRINVAKSKLVPIAQHMANGMTQVNRLLLRGIQTVGEKVIVQNESINVKTAKKYQDRVTVHIEPKNPVDKNQDIGSAKMALEFGLPWDWVAENILGIEDPATIRLQKDILEIEQLPQVKERLMADALEQLDALIQEEEFEDAENLDLSQLPESFAEALASLGGPAVPDENAGIPPEIMALIEGTPPPIQEESGAPASPDELASMLAGAAEPAPDGGLGQGPFPPGAAPQTIAPRGLGTPNTQPGVGTPQIDTSQAGVIPEEGPADLMVQENMGELPLDPAAAAGGGGLPPEPAPMPPAPDPMAQTSQASAPPAATNKGISINQAATKKQERERITNRSTNLSGIPSELAPRWELIVSEATKRIKAKRDTIKIAIGEKPYRGIPVTKEEAENRYLQMRDNAKLQTKALEENVTMSKDGRLLINKEYLKIIKEMEQKIRKGEINL